MRTGSNICLKILYGQCVLNLKFLKVFYILLWHTLKLWSSTLVLTRVSECCQIVVLTSPSGSPHSYGVPVQVVIYTNTRLNRCHWHQIYKKWLFLGFFFFNNCSLKIVVRISACQFLWIHLWFLLILLKSHGYSANRLLGDLLWCRLSVIIKMDL